MGYDVTFHPFSRVDFDYFVDRVLLNPVEYSEQVQRIHDDTGEREYVARELYGKWAEFNERILNGEDFGNTLGFSITGILGYLKPYWYSRGGMLSRLITHEAFSPCTGDLTKIASQANRALCSRNEAVITGNYSSGCYIPFEQMRILRSRLEDEQHAPLIEEAIGEMNIAALKSCVEYCMQNELDLLESSDLYSPGSGRCSTFPKNIRAAYLKNIDDFSNDSRARRE